MAFKDKTDFFGLATSTTGLRITDSNENRQATTANAHNEKGDFVAWEVYGETLSPQCDYVLSKSVTLNSLVCGDIISSVSGYESKAFVFGGMTINTAAGQPPTITVTGEEVPSDTTHNDCRYIFPATTLDVCHHAQTLWSAFTMDSSTGNYLQQANYTAGGTISRAIVDGKTVAFDVTDGQLQVDLTIVQTSDTKPAITADTSGGWKVTAPLTCNNPNGDYPTWTCTLNKALLHASASTSGT